MQRQPPPGDALGPRLIPPHPIEPAPTDVPAFLGLGDGPAALVHSLAEFAERSPQPGALATAVEMFFLTGGRRAWVAPLPELTPGAARSAIADLHPDVSLLAVVADPAPPAPVITAAAEALASRPVMLLVEGPWPDAVSAETAMAAGAAAAVGVESRDAALFWPRMHRATSAGQLEPISPLGSVAGALAATAVFTAATGPRGALPGVGNPVVTLTRPQREACSGLGINVIAAFPGQGTVLWGARTLSADREWRYVPVRRFALFLDTSLSRSLGWAVFEPNGQELWDAVRRDVSTFLHGLWLDDAFPGRTPQEAFFVRCDPTTMTDADIAAGTLVCAVGFAPIKPSEFIVLRITARTATA
jgi:hypothetical protein